jgi:hypothetical protein
VEPVTIEYSWQPEKYKALVRRYGIVRYYVKRLLIAAVVFAAGALALLAEGSPGWWLMAVCFLFEVGYIGRVVTAMPKREVAGLTNGPVTCTLGPKEVAVTSSAGPKTVPWGEVLHAEKTETAYLLLARRRTIVAAVPTSAFTSPSQEYEFVTAVRSHVDGLLIPASPGASL